MMPTDQPRAMMVCRGSVQDGLGHVMRSRQVALELQKHFATKMVVLGDDSPENLLAGYDLDYTITANEGHAITHFRHYRPDVVLFDMLHIDDVTFQRMREASRTVSLSPIFNKLNDVDVVFHRTRVLGDDWKVADGGPEIRCGLDYAVISDHCRRIEETTYRQNLDHDVLSVAISMGGADAPNKTLELLKRLKDVPEKFLFWVLLGEGYAHSYEELVQCIRGSKHEILLAKTNDSMWRILNSCAMVILAGGTTTYEAAYAGLPSINTLQTERHYFLIQELVERGACLHAGYDFNESLLAIRGILTRFSRNRDELLRIHQNASRIIDGEGAARVARLVKQLCASKEAIAA